MHFYLIDIISVQKKTMPGPVLNVIKESTGVTMTVSCPQPQGHCYKPFFGHRSCQQSHLAA